MKLHRVTHLIVVLLYVSFIGCSGNNVAPGKILVKGTFRKIDGSQLPLDGPAYYIFQTNFLGGTVTLEGRNPRSHCIGSEFAGDPMQEGDLVEIRKRSLSEQESCPAWYDVTVIKKKK